MAVGQGYKSYIQVGLESTWGTAVAATHRFRVLNLHVKPVLGVIKSEAMNNTITRSAMFAGGIAVTVEFDLQVHYTGDLMLFDAMMGTGTFSILGDAVTGTNPYTHVYRQQDILNSLTLEAIVGNIPSGKCEQVVGFKLDECTFKCNAGLSNADAVMQLHCVGLGMKTSNVGGTYATPTAALVANTTQDVVLFRHITTATDGSGDSAANIRVKDFEFGLKNMLAKDRFYLGSQYVDEPVRDGFGETTMKLRVEYQSKSIMDAFLQLTQATPSFVFTSGVASNAVTFTLNKAYLTAHEHPVTAPGRIHQTFTWESIDNGAGSGLNTGATVTVVNAQPLSNA